MTDITAPVVLMNVATTAVTGTGIILFGVQLGLEYPILFAAVGGAAAGLSALEQSSIWKRVYQTTTAAIFSGYAAPLFAHIIVHYLIKFDYLNEGTEPPMGVQATCAFLIGYMAHSTILPGLRKISSAFLRRSANE